MSVILPGLRTDSTTRALVLAALEAGHSKDCDLMCDHATCTWHPSRRQRCDCDLGKAVAAYEADNRLEWRTCPKPCHQSFVANMGVRASCPRCDTLVEALTSWSPSAPWTTPTNGVKGAD